MELEPSPSLTSIGTAKGELAELSSRPRPADPRDPHSYIEYPSRSDADEAIRSLSNTALKGSTVTIEDAVSSMPSERNPSSLTRPLHRLPELDLSVVVEETTTDVPLPVTTMAEEEEEEATTAATIAGITAAARLPATTDVATTTLAVMTATTTAAVTTAATTAVEERTAAVRARPSLVATAPLYPLEIGSAVPFARGSAPLPSGRRLRSHRVATFGPSRRSVRLARKGTGTSFDSRCGASFMAKRLENPYRLAGARWPW